MLISLWSGLSDSAFHDMMICILSHWETARTVNIQSLSEATSTLQDL